MGEADRIRPAAVAKMTSLSIRKIQEMSASGKIPSAAKLGGAWTYDAEAIRKWIKAAERATWQSTSGPVISTKGAIRGGDGAKLPDESIEARYEQLIGVKRSGGIKRGGRSLSARR